MYRKSTTALTNEMISVFRGNGKEFAKIVCGNNTFYNGSIKEMSVKRSMLDSGTLTFGSCVASTLELTMVKTDTTLALLGQELTVSVAEKNSSGTAIFVPLGVFTVDEIEDTGEYISIVAYDNMYKFNEIFSNPYSYLASGTLQSYFTYIVRDALGLTVDPTLTWNATKFPNYNTNASPHSGVQNATYRQWLSWICECMGVFCYAKYDGTISIKWFDRITDPANVDFAVNDDDILSVEKRPAVTTYDTIGITTLTEQNYADYTDTEYTISFSQPNRCVNVYVSGNPFLHDASGGLSLQSVATQLSVASGSKMAIFYNYSIKTKSFPFLEQGDSISFLHYTIGSTTYAMLGFISDIEYTLNGSTTISFNASASDY